LVHIFASIKCSIVAIFRGFVRKGKVAALEGKAAVGVK